MRYEPQRAVMIGLHVGVAVGAGACLPPPGVACGNAWCSDRESCVSQGEEAGMQQMVCLTQAIGKPCVVDTDCAPASICDGTLCRVAKSCAEFLLHVPGAKDGVYSIAPGEAPFNVVCDMTRDGGGWTLLLKATGDATLGYNASAWTDINLLNATDLTIQPGNAKYQSFVSLPVTTLRGELDGFLYTKDFASMTAEQIFTAPADFVKSFPTFNDGAPNWSTHPNCRIFGVNTPSTHVRTRFGWSTNEENNCQTPTNDAAIGLGVMNNGADLRGAGYECEHMCNPGDVDTGGHGLLWAR